MAALLPPGAQAQGIEEKAHLRRLPWREWRADRPLSQHLGPAAGLSFFELRDFKSGARKNELMSPIARLDRRDLMALAEYFSNRRGPISSSRAGIGGCRGAGAARQYLIGCTGCHQEGYKGDSTQPRLAGQHHDYLAKTMADFRSGARGNNPGVTDLMKATPEADLAVMATYLAGLQ